MYCALYIVYCAMYHVICASSEAPSHSELVHPHNIEIRENLRFTILSNQCEAMMSNKGAPFSWYRVRFIQQYNGPGFLQWMIVQCVRLLRFHRYSLERAPTS